MLLLKKLPVLLIFFGHAAMGQCICPLQDGGFEEVQKANIKNSKWVREGSAGIDFGASTSYRGRNNGWVKADKGWIFWIPGCNATSCFRDKIWSICGLQQAVCKI